MYNTNYYVQHPRYHTRVVFCCYDSETKSHRFAEWGIVHENKHPTYQQIERVREALAEKIPSLISDLTIHTVHTFLTEE